MYNYFSKHFGTMSDLTKQSLESKYDKLSVRELKKGLHSLKHSATLYCSSEIKYVSALIRNKLRTRMTNKDNDGSSLLRKNMRSKFWTTCHKLFAVGLRAIPTFDVNKCYNYFRATLSASNGNHSFKTPGCQIGRASCRERV